MYIKLSIFIENSRGQPQMWVCFSKLATSFCQILDPPLIIFFFCGGGEEVPTPKQYEHHFSLVFPLCNKEMLLGYSIKWNEEIMTLLAVCGKTGGTVRRKMLGEDFRNIADVSKKCTTKVNLTWQKFSWVYLL